jgi:hypothetical protein
LEFFDQEIEFKIGDLRIIVKIIFFLVIDDLLSQFLDTFFSLN